MYARDNPISIVDPSGMNWLSSFFGWLANAFAPGAMSGTTPPFISTSNGTSIWQKLEDAIVPQMSGGVIDESGGFGEGLMSDPGGAAAGGSADPAESRFAPCVRQDGTANAQNSYFTYKSYLAAQTAANAAGIDTSSELALWDNENSLKPTFGPVGRNGEIGPMQVRPGVVDEEKAHKILPGGWNEDLTANLTAGALYYDRLSDRYGIPEDQVAAAYNGGARNYKRGTVSKAAQAYQRNFNRKAAAFGRLINCIRGAH